MSGILLYLFYRNKLLSIRLSFTCFTTPCQLVIDTRPFETTQWSHIEVLKILKIFRSMKMCLQVCTETSIAN